MTLPLLVVIVRGPTGLSMQTFELEGMAPKLARFPAAVLHAVENQSVLHKPGMRPLTAVDLHNALICEPSFPHALAAVWPDAVCHLRLPAAADAFVGHSAGLAFCEGI